MQMLEYKKFDVLIAREIDSRQLRWPSRGEAGDDSGLGCNRHYMDLRRRTWKEAESTIQLETALVARLEQAADFEAEYAQIQEEMYEDDVGLYGLDIGIASSVVALSAASCVPFSSCNGGAFGGFHAESYPLVAFFSRPQILQALLSCAQTTDIGLENGDGGCVVAFADDIRKIRQFAREVIKQKAAFRFKLNTIGPVWNSINSRQGKLFESV